MPSGPGQIDDELIAEIAAEKAVLAAEPFGLDLCSSVRSDGILDESKLKAFFSASGPCNRGEQNHDHKTRKIEEARGFLFVLDFVAGRAHRTRL